MTVYQFDAGKQSFKSLTPENFYRFIGSAPTMGVATAYSAFRSTNGR